MSRKDVLATALHSFFNILFSKSLIRITVIIFLQRQRRFINFIVPENNPLEAGKLDRETLEVRGRRPGVRPCLFAFPSWLDQTQISQVKTTDLAQFFWEISHRLSYEDWP